ncbi:MAG: LysR family transcriptional regulator [Acidihalobacter sp.]|uniref:LysR family transcriptional regulator n=1 Tax=Acidihalobacter sp. TaxID=1872108 RepID=UPI00307F466C
MTALTCFEAAARNVSFKKAAEEMSVTPAAVSHQIKALETDLECSLFRRHHRGVELTEKGAFLFVAIQRGFETISDAVAELRERPETVDVTIRSSTAVSSLWLTPKISAFWKIHPSITVSQIVSDVPGMHCRCDLSIHYGDPVPGSHHRLGNAGFGRRARHYPSGRPAEGPPDSSEQ